MYSSDVLIIGGGPAGAAAAIWCAKSGLEVTLVEGAKFPRCRVGESLHPGAEALFTQLGVEGRVRTQGFLRYPGVWVTWGRDRHLMRFGAEQNSPWFGFQAWRADLDNILLEQASSLGVSIHQQCRARDVIISDNGPRGIVTSEGECYARFLIDGGGGAHWLARKLKIPVIHFSPPLHVRYGYVKGEFRERDDVPAFTAEQNGWIWTARVRQELYQWTRLNFGNERLPPAWIPQEFRGPSSKCNHFGDNATWRLASKISGPGYFLAGDAACVLDPASSHGVLRAIMSGMQAAHAIVQVLQHGYSEEAAATEYSAWLSKWFIHDVGRMEEFYRCHPSPPAWVN